MVAARTSHGGNDERSSAEVPHCRGLHQILTALADRLPRAPNRAQRSESTSTQQCEATVERRTSASIGHLTERSEHEVEYSPTNEPLSLHAVRIRSTSTPGSLVSAVGVAFALVTAGRAFLKFHFHFFNGYRSSPTVLGLLANECGLSNRLLDPYFVACAEGRKIWIRSETQEGQVEDLRESFEVSGWTGDMRGPGGPKVHGQSNKLTYGEQLPPKLTQARLIKALNMHLSSIDRLTKEFDFPQPERKKQLFSVEENLIDVIIRVSSQP